MEKGTRAVITVIGKDRTGILAKVSSQVARFSGNVIEVTQSVLKEFFCMIMIIDIGECTASITDLSEAIKKEVPDMQIHVMHEDIFNSMHRV